jgi:hypothetical protein
VGDGVDVVGERVGGREQALGAERVAVSKARSNVRTREPSGIVSVP